MVFIVFLVSHKKSGRTGETPEIKTHKTKRQQDSSISVSETNENVYILVFISSIRVCTAFLRCSGKANFKKKKGKDIYLQLIKKRSKVHEKNMLNNRSLNLDQ